MGAERLDVVMGQRLSNAKPIASSRRAIYTDGFGADSDIK